MSKRSVGEDSARKFSHANDGASSAHVSNAFTPPLGGLLSAAALNEANPHGVTDLPTFVTLLHLLVFARLFKMGVEVELEMTHCFMRAFHRTQEGAPPTLLAAWYVWEESFLMALKEDDESAHNVEAIVAGNPTLIELRGKHDGFKFFSVKAQEADDYASIVTCASILTDLLLAAHVLVADASKAVHNALKRKQDACTSDFGKHLPTGMAHSEWKILQCLRPQPTWVVTPTLKFRTKHGDMVNPQSVSCVRVLLFPGVSGKGKTFSATAVPDDTIRALCGNGFKDATVLGLYTLYSACQKSVATWAGREMRQLYDLNCKDRLSGFGKVAVHIVIDEVGSQVDFVREIVEEAPEVEVDSTQKPAGSAAAAMSSLIEREVYSQLQMWYREKTSQELPPGDVRVIVSLVGTGVGRADQEGSLPPHYLICQQQQDLPKKLFVEAAGVAAGEMANVNLQELADKLETDTLFGAMMSNARCASFAGDEVGVALRQFDIRWCTRWSHEAAGSPEAGDASTKPKHKPVPDAAANYLCCHAERIVTQASLRYMNANGWAAQESSRRGVLVSSLVSLLVTQPHGYHLLSPDVISSLCCDVGAMEDTLQWGKRAVKRSEPVVFQRAKAAGAHPCVPNPKENEAKEMIYPLITGHRFVIPPAIAAAVLLVAVTRNFDGGLFGSARQLPSATYENVASTVLWCTLEALRMHSVIAKKVAVVPAVLAFPSLAKHFPRERGRKELVVFQMGPGEIPLLPPDNTTGTNARIDDVVNSCGKKMVLEMAGNGCPRNDLTIHNRGGTSIGVEYKSYTDLTNLSILERNVLERRCFQMGYNQMSIVRVDASGKHIADDSFTVDVEKHDSAQNLRGRYITLCTEFLGRPEGDATPGGLPEREFLVLCSPIGSALLPEDTILTFQKRVMSVHVGETIVETKAAESLTCRVLCMQLGIEELLCRCSTTPPAPKRSLHSNSEYCTHPFKDASQIELRQPKQQKGQYKYTETSNFALFQRAEAPKKL